MRRLLVKLCGNSYGMVQTPEALPPVDLHISQTIRDMYALINLLWRILTELLRKGGGAYSIDMLP